MKKYLVIALLFIGTSGLTSCKKSTDFSNMLFGKWKIDSVQVRLFVNNQVSYETIYKPTVDYYDFNTDYKLYRYWMGNYDTVRYEIVTLNDKSLIQYSSTADTIISLTKKSMIFKNPQGSDSKIFFSKY